MSTLLLYEKPVALSRDAHRHIRMRSNGSFSYAAGTNSVPLACSEFAAAATEYPIVFAIDEKNQSLPVALLGLRQDENVFVSKEGAWDSVYVPAFVRRYPFLLAEKPDPNDFTVCIDEAYAGFGTGTDGDPLFSEDGAQAPALRQAIEFLNHFQGEFKRTQAFVERLKALDLLIPQVVKFTTNKATPSVLQGFAVVDEKRLTALDDKQLGELMRTGYLGWIHAHLISLGNVHRLSKRFELRLATDTKTA
jgi:SapC